MDQLTLEKIEFDAVRKYLGSFCSTSPGRDLAAVVSPDTDADTVRQHVKQTGDMLEIVGEIGLPPLAGLTDIAGHVSSAAAGSTLCGEDFSRIAASLGAAARCRTFLAALPPHLQSIRAFRNAIGDFSAELEALQNVVGPDGAVRDRASERLAELRNAIAETSEKIHDTIYAYARKPHVRKLLSATNVTLHGDRYVLPVRADNRGRLPGVVHRESKTGSTVFVEPAECVELNNHLADLHYHERQEEERLLAQLGIQVCRKQEEIERSLSTLATLDLISAKARYACRFDMVRPRLNGDGRLECYGARNPILEYNRSSQSRESDTDDGEHEVVPIDIRLGGEFDILIITGSNTGGKTVALKTTALLACMAQSGMYIPADEGAAFPIYDDILIDVGDEQSLQQSLSTFGGHLVRLKTILDQSGENTLVLLDELGSGTDPDEGGAIGMAVLDRLGEIGCSAMVTTHFSLLKAYALNNERVENASVAFDTDTLRPTYHLTIGTAGESHAMTVAGRLGLPQAVVKNARKHYAARNSQFRKALRATGEAKKRAEEARAGAAAAKVAAESRIEELDNTKRRYEKLKTDFARWLHRLGNMDKGDRVFIPSLGNHGTLERIELHRQIAVINVESIQREIPLIELMPDFGRAGVSADLDALMREARRDRRRAGHLAEDAEQEAERHRSRARQFDRWLNALGRVRVGDSVPISVKPGRGKLVSLDFARLKARVATEHNDTAAGKKDGVRKTTREIELPIQELFPQTGPFAAHDTSGGGTRAKKGGTRAKDRRCRKKPSPETREKILNTPPGSTVYLRSFKTTGTLLRADRARNTATVMNGALEIQVPLADIALVKDAPG